MYDLRQMCMMVGCCFISFVILFDIHVLITNLLCTLLEQCLWITMSDTEQRSPTEDGMFL